MARNKATNPDMTVKVFSVSSTPENFPLEAVLATLSKVPLERRNSNLLNGDVRLEEIIAPKDGAPYWLLDFVRLRYSHGPGRAGKQRKVVGFDMGNGDGFAEETAMLYYPKSKLLFVQYNHFGVKDGSAEIYFGRFGPKDVIVGFELNPVLDKNVESKLAKADQFTFLTLKVAPGEIDRKWVEDDIALGRALSLYEETKAPQIEITLSVGRSNTTLPTKVTRKAISALQRTIGNKSNAVQKARVIGRNSEDNTSVNEVLDLIAPSLRYTVGVKQDQKTLRFTRDSRFSGLKEAYAKWLRETNGA